MGRSTHCLSTRSKAILTRPSALACSLEMRLLLNLWEKTLSCASEAFHFRSYVLFHTFQASTKINSRAARRLQISPKALLVFTVASSCAARQLENSLAAVPCLSQEQSSSSCRRSSSFLGPFELVSHSHLLHGGL